MLESLFWVILTGGLPVLFSYAYMYNYSDVSDLWGKLENCMYLSWVISVALTVLSYGYLFWFFIYKNTMYESILCAIYVIFLSSAAQWAFFAIIDVKDKKKSSFLLVNLIITALATAGLLVMTVLIGIREGWDIYNVLALVGACIMVLHHAVFDAIVWYSGFLEK